MMQTTDESVSTERKKDQQAVIYSSDVTFIADHYGRRVKIFITFIKTAGYIMVTLHNSPVTWQNSFCKLLCSPSV